MTNDELMGLAIQEAITAKNAGEVPIGAVIEIDGRIVASRHNERETTNDPTAHAEILAIREACKKLKVKKLENCSIFVTLEPCEMCKNAIYQAGIKKIFFFFFTKLIITIILF